MIYGEPSSVNIVINTQQLHVQLCMYMYSSKETTGIATHFTIHSI